MPPNLKQLKICSRCALSYEREHQDDDCRAELDVQIGLVERALARLRADRGEVTPVEVPV